MTCNVDKNKYHGGEKNVTKSIKVKLYPTNSQRKDIDQNIANRGFIWNRLLEKIKYENVKPTQKNLNAIVNELKKEYPFVIKSESSSRQQVYRDLIKAIQKHKKERAGYPRFKSQDNPNTSCRIQCNNNNIHLNKRQNRVKIPTIGYVKFKTSKENKKELSKSKINNITLKIENGIYYAIFNIKTIHNPMKTVHDSIGIDLGIRRPATCSNGLKIEVLDLTFEEEKIALYQKQMSERKPMSRRYKIAQNKYGKWQNKKINKKKDYYHKKTHEIVKNHDIIALETLIIRNWFKNHRWAPKLQKTGIYEILRQLKYKSELNNRRLVQVGWDFPSSQLCSECGYQYTDLKMGEAEWKCPSCGTHHDRDLNASINIKNEGIRLIKKETIKRYQNAVSHGLRCAGVRSVVIFAQ